ncbi:MAG: GWxTD domain-containing protein [Candidatus Latescibacteria bacterium]|nr:GWxTD domain-containing protein [bacterium]MBD3423407.1 GWxTD domain-containing protein [Candidatus Latescibacterota bacterium]
MKRNISVMILALAIILLMSGELASLEVNGKGDFRFFADIIHFPADSAVIQVVQIAVPSPEIEYREYMSGYRAKVRMMISLNGEEGKLYETEREIADLKTASETAQSSGYLFAVDTFRVAPGNYSIRIEMKDLNDRKFSLLGIFFPNYASSSAEDDVRVPSFDPSIPFVSKPVFLWDIKADGSIVPNPMKVYGLASDSMTCMVKTSFGEEYLGRDASITMKVYQGEERFFSDSATFHIDNRDISFVRRLDLSRYPSGSYMFMATLHLGEEVVLRRDRFNMVWELRNWERPDRDKLLEAEFAFEDDRYREFVIGSPGKREKMLNEFWKDKDPVPSTELNEALEEFRRRVNYCEEWFASGGVRGALTDRGRIYIRYGEPDEIVESSIPRNRREYIQVLQKLRDKYEIMTFEIGGSVDDATGNPEYSSSMRGTPFISGGMDVGSYQLWLYNKMGNPLFRRDRLMTQDEGLRFLFVDKNGYGNFLLKGSSRIPEDILDRAW